MKQRIFISSVQMEFAEERQVLKAYLLGDALLSRFFELAFVAVGGQVTEQGEPQPESRPESRPESLEIRVLRLLTASPLGKAELSSGLGQKEISGQLNKVIRVLLGDQTIEYTIPGKPNSRMQRYRLTAKGKAILNTRNVEDDKA